jgi:hypothetical protein
MLTFGRSVRWFARRVRPQPVHCISRSVSSFRVELVGRRLARYRGQRAGRRHDDRAGINDSKHADPRDPLSSIAIASLNIRSALRCFDDIVELMNDQLVDILCLQEMWHDADSPVIG